MTATGARPRRSRRAAPPTAATTRLPWVLAGAAVLAQVAYPLLDGRPLRVVTVATVLLFAAAGTAHAAVHRGPRWAAVFATTTVAVSLAAEAVGVRTGYPFGEYAYAGTLGPDLLGVPLLVPLAWLMMAYPAFVVARRLTRRAVPVVGAVTLTAWDVVLDPQMVAAGHWAWAHPSPALPGVPGIPLTNYAGWLLVGLVLMTLLDRLPRRDDVPDGVPLVLFAWTCVGSVVGNAVFFGRPGVAVTGGLALAVVAVPLAVVLRRERR